MKSKYSIIATLLIMFSIFQICSLKAQEGLTEQREDDYVTKFNTEEMVKMYLPNFSLLRKRAMWNTGSRFVYQSEIDHVNVSITVGLHPSALDAEQALKTYRHLCSMVMIEEPIPGFVIGDKICWWSPDNDINNIKHIFFLRKNALVLLNSSQSFGKLPELAAAIDKDLRYGSTYLSIEKVIFPPKINSISAGKNNLFEKEKTKITVNVTDSKNESLEFQFSPGLPRRDGDPTNVFIFEASKDYVTTPFLGSHLIKVVAINESNMVSRVSVMQINCVQ